MAATWTRVDGDRWVYGEPIRGIVRHKLAEVYYDMEYDNWKWLLNEPPYHSPGVESTLIRAVEAAEKALKDRKGLL